MVEWIPIIGDSANPASLADGTAVVIVDFTMVDPLTLDRLDPGTIVNGWLDIIVYTTDAAALSTSRGPVRAYLMLIPDIFDAVVTKVQTGAELKEYDDIMWMMLQAFLEGGSTSVLRLRFDLHTLRKFARGYHIVIVLENDTGAAFPSTAKAETLGELYVQPG